MLTETSASNLLDAYSQQAHDLFQRDPLAWMRFDSSSLDACRAVQALPRPEQVAIVVEAAARLVDCINSRETWGFVGLQALLRLLLRKKLPFAFDSLTQLVRTMGQVERSGWWSAIAPGGILKAAEEHVAAHGMPAALRDALLATAARLKEHAPHYAEPRKLLQRVETLLASSAATNAEADGELPPVRGSFQFTTDEAWTRFLSLALEKVDDAARTAWDALLIHCASAKSSKPSGKWIKQAETLVSAIKTESFVAVLGGMLGEIGKPGAPQLGLVNALGFAPDPTQIHETHSDLLRGLAWCAGLAKEDALTTAIGDAAEACFKKLPGIGPRAPKIGNACLWALSSMSSTAAVAQLSRIKTRAKHASIKTQLAKAFDVASEKTGLSPDDLEDIAVPTCGLTAVGECRQQLGDVTAVLQVKPGASAELTWLKPDGRAQASVPSAVKESFAAEAKTLQRMKKDIDKLHPAQRARLEQLFLRQRSWTFPDFRTRFLDHPLVGTLARRLIWRLNRGERHGDGIWRDGQLVDAGDQPLDWLDDGSRVSVWHPIDSSVDEVRAWRDWLESHELSQPFKQAHREVYLLTDAERATSNYSNRFAAHILKQHAFAALCHQRCWRYTLQGEWDSANTPTLELPLWDLRVEFWLHQIPQAGPISERNDLSHRMVYLYVSSDQVRFYRRGEFVPLPLTDVPPHVFSEVMRDVDLFVGVASVGNDPGWVGRGLLPRYTEYWESCFFGELMPSAQTRKAVLERVVPRLAIANRCSFGDKHLIVRGDLHTYKIHLGSGNVMMDPDRYLCIVPTQGVAATGRNRVFLPFEGDDMLSIILSKALLLADDRQINDPSIVHQLQNK
jgi:hypothetical protein